MRFAVRRPAQRLASPRSHGMPCRDVLGSIHIGVISVSAGHTAKGRLALAVLSRSVAATVTTLRSKSCPDELNPSSRFVSEPLGDHPPCAVADPAIQLGLATHSDPRVFPGSSGRAGHLPDPQVFELDDIEAPGEHCRLLLDPIPAPIALAGQQAGDREFDASSPCGSRLSSAQFASEMLETALLGWAKLRSNEQLSGRESDRDGDSAIDANDLLASRRFDLRGDRCERDVPSAGSVECHPVGLRGWGESAPSEFGPAHFGDSNRADILAQATKMRRLERDHAESFVDSGLPPGRWPMRSVEECTHRLAEVAQRLLLNGLRTIPEPLELPASLGELSRLLEVAGCRSAVGSPEGVLLDREIPDKSGMPAMKQQGVGLLGCRLQTVSGHESSVASTTDRFRDG